MVVVLEKNEQVLCMHGAVLYDAKVVEVVQAPGGRVPTHYKIHYLGWKRSWDETVDHKRLYKRTEENLVLKEQLMAQLLSDPLKKGSKAADTVTAPGEDEKRTSAARKKLAASGLAKRPLAPGADALAAPAADEAAAAAPAAGAADEAPEAKGAELHLVVPQALKVRLVADWESITREHKLVALPRSPTVADILEEWCSCKARRSPVERVYREIQTGLKTYFHQALGQVLLYSFERKQFSDLALSEQTAHLPPEEVYGAEHLLRLLVTLPELLESARLDEAQAIVLQAKIQELLRFLQKNQTTFFPGQYVAPPREYVKWFEAQDDKAPAADAPANAPQGRPAKRPAATSRRT